MQKLRFVIKFLQNALLECGRSIARSVICVPDVSRIEHREPHERVDCRSEHGEFHR
jgi:hypothetical protein